MLPRCGVAGLAPELDTDGALGLFADYLLLSKNGFRADSNGDRIADFALASHDPGIICVFPSTGRGHFGAEHKLQSSADCHDPVVAGLTGDGALDRPAASAQPVGRRGERAHPSVHR
jgi:hypothetical protein